MAKKMEQVIRDARESGLDVRYKRVKEDGWTRIRVLSINGEEFKKSRGNTELRRRMGEQLSASELRSRKEANVGTGGTSSSEGFQRARHARLPKKTPKLSKAERRAIAKVNRTVRKLGTGTKISYRGARLLKARGGRGAVVDEAKRHYLSALGLASVQTINNCLSDLYRSESLLSPEQPTLAPLIQMLRKLVYKRQGRLYERKKIGIKDRELLLGWKLLYDYEKKSPKECLQAREGAKAIWQSGIIEI